MANAEIEIKSGALYRLQQLQLSSSDPMHYLFSPTTLARDLSYVDKTYYDGSRHTGSRERSEQPTTLKNDESTSWVTGIKVPALRRSSFHFVSTMSHVDLRNAGLHSLPTEVTSLVRLSYLDLSQNKLNTLPACMRRLKRLRHLNLAHNRLQCIPGVVGHLGKLVHLDVSHNGFRDVPLQLSGLMQLKWLDLSHSRIDAIPAELLRLTKATIKLDVCPRLQRKASSRFQHSLAHSPPSLVEICARQLAADEPATPPLTLPIHLAAHLSQQKHCSFCGRVYFGSPVVRYRITLHSDGHYIPVKYQMCAAHWADDTDRILAFFSQPT